MTGYIGSAADAAQQLAMDAVESSLATIRAQAQMSYGNVSRSTCLDCEEPIPEGRQHAVPGVQYCVNCQDHHMVSIRYKMLTKML